MQSNLTLDEKQYLLKAARQAIKDHLSGIHSKPISPDRLTPILSEPGASFVTLTIQGELRGCIGTLEPYLPLVEDVREHAVASATQDYRFPPVKIHELERIKIEISRLTKPEPLIYQLPKELPGLLHPHIDGVVLKDGIHRATFLPQVWEKLPDPEEFLSHLCMKMGAPADLWRYRKMEVLIYKVEEFQEE